MTTLVSAVALPKDSRLWGYKHPKDFMDCFCVIANMPARQAAEIVVNFPVWARVLIFIRYIMTTPFGLDQDGPTAADKLGPFPVEMTSDTEVVAGFNDKHLNFRVSVVSNEGRIYLATWVHTHNLLGRAYLKMIMPFHILIARNALARVAKQNPTAYSGKSL